MTRGRTVSYVESSDDDDARDWSGDFVPDSASDPTSATSRLKRKRKGRILETSDVEPDFAAVKGVEEVCIPETPEKGSAVGDAHGDAQRPAGVSPDAAAEHGTAVESDQIMPVMKSEKAPVAVIEDGGDGAPGAPDVEFAVVEKNIDAERKPDAAETADAEVTADDEKTAVNDKKDAFGEEHDDIVEDSELDIDAAEEGEEDYMADDDDDEDEEYAASSDSDFEVAPKKKRGMSAPASRRAAPKSTPKSTSVPRSKKTAVKTPVKATKVKANSVAKTPTSSAVRKPLAHLSANASPGVRGRLGTRMPVSAGLSKAHTAQRADGNGSRPNRPRTAVSIRSGLSRNARIPKLHSYLTDS